MSLVASPKNCDPSVRQAIQKLALKLGPVSEPTFAGLTVTGFTAGLVHSSSSGVLSSGSLYVPEYHALLIED